jgi:glycosyltransferase 2 family protein
MEDERIEEAVLAGEGGRSRSFKLALGYLIAAACLAWVLVNVHPRRFLHAIAHLDWGLVVLAIAIDNVNYALQGIRWALLLRPLGRTPLTRAIQAIYVGLFGNEVFPLRFGELMRAQLMARWCGTKLPEIVPSIVMERLFEGIWLGLGIVLAVVFLPLPPLLRTSAHVFVNIMAVLTAVFLFATFRRRGHPAGDPDLTATAPTRTLLNRIRMVVVTLDEGLHRIGVSRASITAFAVTLAALSAQAVALWLVVLAYGLNLSIWQATVVLIIVRIGSVVPNAPANIGPYQFFAALGIELFGIDRPAANGFALVLFVVLSGPIWGLGFLALGRTGETLFSLRREVRDAAHID